MDEVKKAGGQDVGLDTEAILLTLDQIGQTIDVMTHVVDKLRGYINEQGQKPPQSLPLPACDRCGHEESIDSGPPQESKILH